MYTIIASDEDMDYWFREGLDAYFQVEREIYVRAMDIGKQDNKLPFLPQAGDLVRLHKLIRQRKVLTVLEFGVGFSTLVMADALAKNMKDHKSQFDEMGIRCLHPFKLYSVEVDKTWAEKAASRIPVQLQEHIEVSLSSVRVGTFNDRICHYYSRLPNIIPDFIYLDGPDGPQVEGDIDGSDFAVNCERTVISGDLLRIEPTLTPGTMIVVDGRVNNARFLRNNFQRKWRVKENREWDVTIFELAEEPLGPINARRLEFHGLL